MQASNALAISGRFSVMRHTPSRCSTIVSGPVSTFTSRQLVARAVGGHRLAAELPRGQRCVGEQDPFGFGDEPRERVHPQLASLESALRARSRAWPSPSRWVPPDAQALGAEHQRVLVHADEREAEVGVEMWCRPRERIEVSRRTVRPQLRELMDITLTADLPLIEIHDGRGPRRGDEDAVYAATAELGRLRPPRGQRGILQGWAPNTRVRARRRSRPQPVSSQRFTTSGHREVIPTVAHTPAELLAFLACDDGPVRGDVVHAVVRDGPMMFTYSWM